MQTVRFSGADQIEMIRCGELKRKATLRDFDVGMIVIVENVTHAFAVDSGPCDEIVPVDVHNAVVVDPLIGNKEAVACAHHRDLEVAAQCRC